MLFTILMFRYWYIFILFFLIILSYQDIKRFFVKKRQRYDDWYN